MPYIENKYIIWNNDVEVYHLDFENLNDNLKNIIDTYIIKLFKWNKKLWTIQDIKKIFTDFLNPKKGSTLEIWRISEFFIHIFLMNSWYTTEFLFENLEEQKSIKKWFDWFYKYNWESWIMESKSGKIDASKITHRWKVKEAYDDLAKKFKWVTDEWEKYNPWHNAYSHMKNADSSEDLLEKINELDIRMSRWEAFSCSDFNIIPASTIFLDGKKGFFNKNDVIKEIGELVSKLEYKNMQIICVTHKTIEIIYNYLQSR